VRGDDGALFRAPRSVELWAGGDVRDDDVYEDEDEARKQQVSVVAPGRAGCIPRASASARRILGEDKDESYPVLRARRQGGRL
jgi:hypothetical protein